MVIFLLWLGLICCAVANGLIYDRVQAPEINHYLLIVGLVAAILLAIHRFYTRHWEAIEDEHSKHSSVFISSTIVSVIVGVSSLFAVHVGEVSWGFPFGCFTAFVLFGVAALKERKYV